MNNTMTASDQAYFTKKGLIKKNKASHKGSWSLVYLNQTFPEATNSPYGVCMTTAQHLARTSQYNKDNFKIIPA